MGYLGFQAKENMLRLSIKPLNYMWNGVDFPGIDGLTGPWKGNGCANLLNIIQRSMRMNITFRLLLAEKAELGEPPLLHWRPPMPLAAQRPWIVVAARRVRCRSAAPAGSATRPTSSWLPPNHAFCAPGSRRTRTTYASPRNKRSAAR